MITEEEVLNVEKELVSVIIPVFNTEKYISKCLDSVLGQTYKNIEVILINDGSTDNSADVCARYADDPRVLFINRENRGLSQTRQQGIETANGTYFCNLDSDDLMDAMFIEKMLNKAKEHNADIVACGRKDFDETYEESHLLTATRETYDLTQEIVAQQIPQLHRELWLADSWNKMYKMSFVKSSGVEYSLNNKYNGTDYLYNHQLILHCPRYAVLNEPLLLHRIVFGSRVHRKNKPLQEGFQEIVGAVFGEAKKLNYTQLFFENYSYCYTGMLDMVYGAILRESESISEAKPRLKKYFEMRQKFEKKNTLLSARLVNKKRTSLGSKMYYESMTGDSVAISALVFLLMQAKEKHKSGEVRRKNNK